MRAYENFASVGRLEVLSTLNFSEATSGHPEFFVEKHGSAIFKTPASVPRPNNTDFASFGIGRIRKRNHCQHSSRFAAATETTRSSQKFRILPCVPLKKSNVLIGSSFQS